MQASTRTEPHNSRDRRTPEALTVAAAASTALAGVLLIAGRVAAVLVGTALAAQWALQCGITLGTLVQAHARMQHRLDDRDVVALGEAAVGKSGGAVLTAVGAVREPCVGAGRALCRGSTGQGGRESRSAEQ